MLLSHCQLTNTKKPQQAFTLLNLESLSILALAGFLRKHIFYAMGQAEEEVKDNLGIHVAIHEITEEVSRPDCKTIITPSLWNEAETMKWLNDTLGTH